MLKIMNSSEQDKLKLIKLVQINFYEYLELCFSFEVTELIHFK